MVLLEQILPQAHRRNVMGKKGEEDSLVVVLFAWGIFNVVI